MQTKIKSEVNYKDPKHYGKKYDVALEEYTRLRLAGVTVKLCNIVGTKLYVAMLLSSWVIENKLKHLKIVL